MTNTLVFVEACSVCYRVQRTYLGVRSRRKTPLVCAECAERAQAHGKKEKEREPAAGSGRGSQ